MLTDPYHYKKMFLEQLKAGKYITNNSVSPTVSNTRRDRANISALQEQDTELLDRDLADLYDIIEHRVAHIYIHMCVNVYIYIYIRVDRERCEYIYGWLP